MPVTFDLASGRSTTLHLAPRITYVERRQDLGRLSPGLLIVYPRDRVLGVNLGSTGEASDLLLLDGERRIQLIADERPSGDGRWVAMAPALYRYAVVLPAGTARGRGLKKGQQARFRLPPRAQPALTLTPVTLHPAGRKPVRVLSELALTQPERTTGLMYRRRLPPLGGMLFAFPRAHVISFWMKNTLIPLDIIFVGAHRKVTGVVRRATPKTLSPRHVGRVHSRYVLEVRGGFAARHGIEAGTPVVFGLPAPIR